MRGLRSAFVWKQNAYKSFVGIPKAKFVSPQVIICKYNIKMDPTLVGFESVDSFQFPEQKEKLYVFVDKVMKLESQNS